MTQSRWGLVLGAGGALGAAWMVGALAALHDTDGLDATEADILVGTSAGSVLAALLCCGIDVVDLAARLAEPGAPATSGTGPVNPFDVHAALAAIPRPVLLPGNLSLAAGAALRRRGLMTMAAGLAPRGRGELGPVAELIASAQAGRSWPRAPRLRVIAMDFDSGHRISFGSPDAPSVDLPAAVTASCAAPGFFPPVLLDDHRYVDGGAVSMTNADVLLDTRLDEVIVLAPMAGLARRRRWSPSEQFDRSLRRGFTRRLATEVQALEANGCRVRVLAPTSADLEAMGFNMMNPARRQAVLAVAIQTTFTRLTDERSGVDTGSERTAS
jgi:NTE family protein